MQPPGAVFGRNNAPTEQQSHNQQYWSALCPELTVGPPASQRPPRLPGARRDECRRLFRAEGYFCLEGPELGIEPAEAEAVASAVKRLTEHGWPPSFVLVYAEALAVAGKAASQVRRLVGCQPLWDVQASHVDPAKAQVGFPPHRDRPFGEEEEAMAPGSFRENGLPKFCTIWLALRPATPDNGCLYVVPASADWGYRRGDQLSAASPDAVPAEMFGLRRSPCGEPIWSPNTNHALAAIRAVPLAQASAVVISHRILHWGSRGRAGSPLGPRVSLSVSLASSSFERPFLKAAPAELGTRLALAAAASLSYEDQAAGSVQLSSQLKQLMVKLAKAGLDNFRPGYRKRVKRILRSLNKRKRSEN